jgi:hypothetical protein
LSEIKKLGGLLPICSSCKKTVLRFWTKLAQI